MYQKMRSGHGHLLILLSFMNDSLVTDCSINMNLLSASIFIEELEEAWLQF